MSSGVFVLQKDGSLVEMNQQDYDSEDVLQNLLAKYPNLLAGNLIDEVNPRLWLLISREYSIPDKETPEGRWSLDHLFLDQDGIPTLVEVKRGTSTRIRREVVGQMLEYAANAVSYWAIDRIKLHFESRCEEKGEDPEQIWRDKLQLEDGYEEYWQNVYTNLQMGKIRMLFIADEIPNELKQIVEFLNEQMNPAEVLALEIKQYVGEDQLTLIPRIYGQSSKIQIKKARGIPRRTWEEKLDWTNPEIREITLTLKQEIETRFTNLVQRESGSHYIFNKGKGGQKNRFAVLDIQKKALSIRIRFDPETCVDRDGMLKDRVYAWFMKGTGQEREFHINNENQIDSALELISQSYDLVE